MPPAPPIRNLVELDDVVAAGLEQGESVLLGPDGLESFTPASSADLTTEAAARIAADNTESTARVAHAALTTSAHDGIVASTDSRLTDQRVPTDGSVTLAKLAFTPVTTLAGLTALQATIVAGNTLRLKNSVSVTGRGEPDVAIGTVGFEVDEYGNFLVGPNIYVPSREGTDDLYVPDFFYAADKRVLYSHGLKVASIDDPPDISLGRTGPLAVSPVLPTGVANGNCLGEMHFKGWTTPMGGTVGVTTGGGWNADSATIMAFATEDFTRDGGGNYHQGGELRIQTTPNTTATPVDRVVFANGGQVIVLAVGLTSTQALVFATSAGDFVTGHSIFACDRITARQDQSNGANATQVCLGDIGPSNEGGISFHSNQNLRLYRVADDNLGLTGDYSARWNASQQTKIGAVGPSSQAGILLGNSGSVTLYKSASSTAMIDSNLSVGAVFRHLGSSLGFFNHATGTQPTVTGSRGANAALASLLTGLASLGLIVDSSS